MSKVIAGLLLGGSLFAFQAAAQVPAQQCVTNAVAGGTSDAITVPLLPCGLATNILILTITANNTTTTPTLQMAGYPAQPIYTNTLVAPGIGDFGGAGSVLMLTSTGSSWLIINGNVGGYIPLPLSVANGGTGDATLTSHGLLYGNTTSAVGVTAAGTTGQYLKGSTGAAPLFGTLASDAVTTLAFGSTGLTPSAATSGAITVAGDLIVANGGTGATTLTNHGVLLGQGTSSIVATAVGSTGQYLKGTTGADASFGTLASDAVTSISFGTTGLTPSSATPGVVTVAGTLGFANGGTSNTSYTNGQLLIGNTGTGGLSKATLTAGTNVTITNSAGGITIASTGLASGCGTSPNPSGELLTSDGAGACTSNADATFATGIVSLGTAMSEVGGVKLFNATSGSVTLAPVTGALGTVTASLPANTGTLAELNLAQSWSAVQTFANNDFRLGGAGAGFLTQTYANAAGSNTITWPAGTTDFSATGGANQVVKQASSGGAFTVGTIACAGLSDATTACSTSIGTSGATIPLLNTTNTWSAQQIFSGSSSVLAASLVNGKEPATISATAATGTINYDICTQSIIYYTSNAAANWTVNFRCSSGTSLNTAMNTGDVVTVTFLVTQGASPFYNNVVQVDTNAVTPKYQGGTAWAAGNASSIDAYTYAITKTGSAAFTIFASQTQFK